MLHFANLYKKSRSQAAFLPSAPSFTKKTNPLSSKFYASSVIGATFSIEDARAQRMALRKAAKAAGRDPDEIKFFAGVMPALGVDKRDALNKRLQLGKDLFASRVPYLGHMLSPLSSSTNH